MNLTNEFNSDVNIFYYKNRIFAIKASIESMILEYREYIQESDMSYIYNLLEKMTIIERQYNDISSKESINRDELAKIVNEAFTIEDGLVDLSSKIWNGEIKKGEIALFHAIGMNDPSTKGFASTTVIFFDPNENIEIINDTFRSVEYGEAYELKDGENILVGNCFDISSGVSTDLNQEIHFEHFETRDGQKMWSKYAGSRICTPLQAAKVFKLDCYVYENFINEITIDFYETTISKYKTPKYMIFSGRLEGYVLLRLYMEENGVDLPIKPICLNPARKIDINKDDIYKLGGAYSYGVNTKYRKRKIDELCKEYYEFMQQYENMPAMDMDKIYEARGHGFTAEKVELDETGEIYRLKKQDRFKKTYLFKPAQNELGEIEEFRAYAQEAAYYVQSIVNLNDSYSYKNSAIKCKPCIVNIDGKKIFGTMQEEIPVKYNGITLKDGKFIEIVKNDPSITDQLMKEFVIDYLLCNLNSHAGDFIINENGILMGVNKEQAFEHINEMDDCIDIFYHPDGEQESIYNTMFKMYINGEIDINFDVIEKYIEIVEGVNDWQYMEFFRTYAQSLYGGKNNESEALLTRIRERKTHLREECLDLVFKLKNIRAKFDSEQLSNASDEWGEKPSGRVKLL